MSTNKKTIKLLSSGFFNQRSATYTMLFWKGENLGGISDSRWKDSYLLISWFCQNRACLKSIIVEYGGDGVWRDHLGQTIDITTFRQDLCEDCCRVE